MLLARLPPNFGGRNDLVSVFYQTLTLAKGGWRQTIQQHVLQPQDYHRQGKGATFWAMS